MPNNYQDNYRDRKKRLKNRTNYYRMNRSEQEYLRPKRRVPQKEVILVGIIKEDNR